MSNYEDILDRGFKEIPQPVPLPQGSYRLKARGANIKPWTSKSGEEGAVVTIVEEPLEALDDVSDDVTDAQLEAHDGIFNKFYVTSLKDERRVWNHLKVRGVDVGNGGLKEALEAAKGSEVIGVVGLRHYTNNSGENVTENQVLSYRPVE